MRMPEPAGPERERSYSPGQPGQSSSYGHRLFASQDHLCKVTGHE